MPATDQMVDMVEVDRVHIIQILLQVKMVSLIRVEVEAQLVTMPVVLDYRINQEMVVPE
jgi:hypothetical protein